MSRGSSFVLGLKVTSGLLTSGTNRSALAWATNFLAALRERLEAVHDNPESSPIVYRDIRRAVVSRFPYLVFYLASPERVMVLAVLHHARNPAVWPRR
jgi:plasmid stabilization system protein ParE